MCKVSFSFPVYYMKTSILKLGGKSMIKIGAIFVPVRNVEKAIEWYKEKLELHHVGTWPEDTGADFYFTTEKQYLSLVKVEEKQSGTFHVNKDQTLPYYNFSTDNLEAYRKKLQRKGVTVTDIEDLGPVVGFDFFDQDENMFSVVVDKDNDQYFYVKEE